METLYLGDGLYVKPEADGLWLLANDHENPTDKVFLEVDVLENFLRYVKAWKKEQGFTDNAEPA